MIKQKLIDKFGGVINHMSCIYLNDGETHLRKFLKKVKPKNVIEIGTYQGVSAAIIAEYAKLVYTIDIIDKPLKKDIWNFLDIKNIEFVKIKNNNQKKDFIQKTDADMIFIDGEHYNGELKNDFEISKHVKYILIHDYAPSFKEVYDFCNNIKGWQKETSGTFCLLTKDSFGEEIEETKQIQPEDIVKPKKRRRRKKELINA